MLLYILLADCLQTYVDQHCELCPGACLPLRFKARKTVVKDLDSKHLIFEILAFSFSSSYYGAL